MQLYIHASGRRYRIHHGRTGALLVLLGTGLMLHDRRDFPWSTR